MDVHVGVHVGVGVGVADRPGENEDFGNLGRR